MNISDTDLKANLSLDRINYNLTELTNSNQSIINLSLSPNKTQ